jgi:ankyrin repeat protein
MSNQTSVIEPLLEDRDNKGRTALHRASESGNLSQVIALLEQGAKINTEDNDWKTPLHLAAQNGEKAVVQYLLKMGANVHGTDSDHRQALHLAAERGHEEAVLCLLLEGANINAKDTCGRTALHYAAVNGHEPVLKVLLRQGADATINDEDDHTARHLAAKSGQKTAHELLLTPEQKTTIGGEFQRIISAKDLIALRRLLNLGEDPNFVNLYGATLLHLVAGGSRSGDASKSVEMAKLLLDRGADVNAKQGGCQDMTPLHLAVIVKGYATVELLLERGADIDAKTTHGLTSIAFASAISSGDQDILRLLQAKSALRSASSGAPRGVPLVLQVSHTLELERACFADGRTRSGPFLFGWELS